MVGIPPVLDSDAEDVAWALQTAEALWKRNERVDAIVWLRRAAQAAGEAEDDDRALALARGAAELAESLAQAAPVTSIAPSTPSQQPGSTDAVEDLLRRSQVDIEVADVIPPSAMPMSIDLNAVEDTISPEQAAPPPPDFDATPIMPPVRELPPPDPAELATSEDTLVPRESAVPPPPPPPTPPPATSTPIEAHAEVRTRPRSIPDVEPPTAAVAHAGMLDPWAESDSAPPPREIAVKRSAEEPRVDPQEDVVTSAPPPAMKSGAPPPVHAPPPPAVPKKPPPLPPRAKPAAPAGTLPPAPAVEEPALDLAAVDAFSDLPDDARVAFANAAHLTTLKREEEVSSFALVLVLEGAVDVAATIVEAPAERLEAGAVLRSRGTLDHRVPLRLLCASVDARVATWDDAAVEEAFRTCPWVEDDLKTAGNRIQALVGLTMGPLGERLDAGLREQVTDRLELRTLEEGEIVAEQGKPVPGIVVIGVGGLDLVRDDVVERTLDPGEFLFASEVLGGGKSPSTARAGKGGALVMTADRAAAQELLVTCPPLLEIFAGM